MSETLSVAALIGLLRDEPRFDFLACPVCLAQKREAGFDARIHLEATDRDALPHFDPTKARDQPGEDRLQRDAVQGIVGMMGR